jgi:hypothetical protein
MCAQSEKVINMLYPLWYVFGADPSMMRTMPPKFDLLEGWSRVESAPRVLEAIEILPHAQAAPSHRGATIVLCVIE